MTVELLNWTSWTYIYKIYIWVNEIEIKLSTNGIQWKNTRKNARVRCKMFGCYVAWLLYKRKINKSESDVTSWHGQQTQQYSVFHVWHAFSFEAFPIFACAISSISSWVWFVLFLAAVSINIWKFSCFLSLRVAKLAYLKFFTDKVTKVGCNFSKVSRFSFVFSRKRDRCGKLDFVVE